MIRIRMIPPLGNITIIKIQLCMETEKNRFEKFATKHANIHKQVSKFSDIQFNKTFSYPSNVSYQNKYLVLSLLKLVFMP